MITQTRPSIVFVQADGSCFSKVIPTLQAHVPMLSNPGLVVDVIRTAALAVR
jgi:hypothetical protein